MKQPMWFSKDDIQYFESNNIKDTDKIFYSRNNLIIGENGAGKTRFLKSIENQKRIFKNSTDTLTITLYFPEISSVMPAMEELSIDEIELEDNPFVYDVLRGNVEIDFKDFLKIVENANDRNNFIREFIRSIGVTAPREKKKAMAAYKKFNEIFRELLNREFSEQSDLVLIDKFYSDGSKHSYKLEDAFSHNNISPGELMLFHFVLFLYFLEVTCTKKVTLLLDEPEQHLHPQKLLFLIKRLMGLATVSELWIASHSLFLIPLFDFEGLILMKNSKVLPRKSDTYAEAYNNLVGFENTDIFEFLKSVSSWQYYRFIIECFCLPNAVQTKNKPDEQITKIITSLKAKQNTKPLRVLDYGAGKCRLWDCLKCEFDDIKERSDLIHYSAYEPHPYEDYDYDDSINLYTDIEGLTREFDGDFDIVILMNVLHEIQLDEWLNTFEAINKLLNKDGIIILVEVKQLTNGEQPFGNNGYLVLSDEQISILFDNVMECIMNKENNLKKGDKSSLWVIDKIALDKISEKKIIKCIESLRDNSEKKLKHKFIDRIQLSRSGNKENIDKSAREYAFLSQQYINAKLALELQGEVEKSFTDIDASSLGNKRKVPPPPIVIK